VIVALWSAPRSRSTAFFRMMLERGDVTAVHEPFSTRAEHGHVAIDGEIARSEADVILAIRRLGERGPVFFKDTTDERYQAVLDDDRFLQGVRHTFLLRHPAETIPSYYALNPAVRRDQIGFEALHEIFATVWRRTGEKPVVVDSDDLVRAPSATVAAYCAAVAIPFVPLSLTWARGDRAEWSATKRWHAGVSATTGFENRAPTHGVELGRHPELREHLAHHLPFYERLREHRIAV